MAKERRRGKKDSKTRIRLIDEALLLLAEEGIGALSARSLAQRLDLSFQIVHYYFKSMDDLLIAVIEQNIVETLETLRAATQSSDPMKTLVEMHRGPVGVALGLEFEIYASRRPAIREAVKSHIEQYRQAELDVVSSHLKLHKLDKNLSASAITDILTSTFRVMAIEEALGVTKGHKETLSWLSSLIDHPLSFDVDTLQAPEPEAPVKNLAKSSKKHPKKSSK